MYIVHVYIQAIHGLYTGYTRAIHGLYSPGTLGQTLRSSSWVYLSLQIEKMSWIVMYIYTYIHTYQLFARRTIYLCLSTQIIIRIEAYLRIQSLSRRGQVYSATGEFSVCMYICIYVHYDPAHFFNLYQQNSPRSSIVRSALESQGCPRAPRQETILSVLDERS